MLRKTVSKNTWIYVSDMQCGYRGISSHATVLMIISLDNFFVGMKTTGTFQHSSCQGRRSTDVETQAESDPASSVLSGGKVTCAGVIQCRDGKIQSLSPLSGHYRGSIEVRLAMGFEERSIDSL